MQDGTDRGPQPEPTASDPAPAVATYALLGIMAFVYLVEAMRANTVWDIDVVTLQQLGGLKRAFVVQDKQVWRFLTAPLLHGGIVHIGLNSLALTFCRRLEPLVGTLWFIAIFVVSAVCGGVASLLINPANTVSVGASGGIMGLFAAQAIAAFHLEPGTALRKEMQEDAMRVLAPSLIPVLFLGSGGVHGGIDVAAHMGGAIAGLILGGIRLIEWGDADLTP
ncbi:MAG: rhomboid family intramembrane serine protease [Hyphomicrobiales bacterium]|nr:MAG: rhomboid family intramembrane serine protease [Hyphomicrobiales bacterium]